MNQTSIEYAKASQMYSIANENRPIVRSDTPQSIGNIQIALGEQDRMLNVLVDEIGILEARLKGVLNAGPPTASGASIDKHPSCSACADTINMSNGRIAGIAYRIKELTARVDI